MIYEYKCTECGRRVNAKIRGDRLTLPCPDCNNPGPLHRVFSINVKPMMHEHFNHAVGTTISDMNQFKAELRRKSDEASEQTGIPHSYAPLEYGDHDAFGATSEGIDESNSTRSRNGDPLLPVID